MAAIIRTHPRKIIAGVAIAGFLASPYAPAVFHTPGVDNIEKRWSAGGGSRNHTPATATKLGDPDNVAGNLVEEKGMGSPHYQEKIGGQKPEVRF
ncbi:MAG: hypothetical protein Q9220_007137 [cf. Caloplaca sp. 1 TL-2023]